MDPIEAFMRTMVRLRSQHGGVPAGSYSCFEEFLLDKGHAYAPMKLTPGEAAFVKAIRKRGRYPIKQCFANSMKVVLDHWMSGDTKGPVVKYAEGYFVRTDLGFPIHHAWIDLNGKVVDLTVRKGFGKGPLIGVGDFGTDAHYWGATFDADEVRRFVIETQTYGSLLDDWKRGWPYMKIGYKP